MDCRSVRIISVAMLVGTMGSSAWGGPLHPEWVAAEATWVAHFDAEAFKASTLGGGVLDIAGAEVKVEIEEIKAEIGLDPLTDIFGLSVFGEGKDESTMTMILEASDAIEGLLERAPEMGAGYRKFTDGGSTIHAWQGDGDEWYAFVKAEGAADRRVVLISRDLVRLRAGVLRFGARAGEAASPALREARPTAGSIAFFSATELPALDDEDEGPARFLLKNAKGLVAQVAEADGKFQIRVSLDTGDAEQANNLMMMAQGLLAMGRIAAASEPEMKEALPVFNAVRFTADGGIISVSMEYEAGAILSIIKADMEAESRREGDGEAKGKSTHKVRIGKKIESKQE